MRQRIGIMVITATIAVLIFAAGCITINVTAPGANSREIPLVQAAPAPMPVIPEVPAETDRVLMITPPEPVPTTPNPYSKYDVNKRFQEVVFGNEALYLNRWENRYIKLGIAGDYTDEDLKTLTDFVLRFNNESDTTRLTRPYENDGQEFTIYIVDPSFFLTIDENKADKVVRNTKTGEILFVDYTHTYSWVERDVIYINSRFTGEQRKYLILRGLLYDLGFEGYTGDTDSIFFYAANRTDLSEMDWAVVDLLYSKKFSYGESHSSVKSKLN